MNVHILIMVVAGGLIALVVSLARRVHLTVRRVHLVSGSADADVLALQRQSGADLSKQTEHLFYLYFSTVEQALAAAGEMVASSAEHDVVLEALTMMKPAEPRSDWSLCLTMQMVPDAARLAAVSDWLMATALPHDGEFDGYAIAVTK